MATRLAMLETIAQNTQVTLAGLQQDMRELRQTVERQYTGLRQELETKIGGLRQEMEFQNGGLRQELIEQRRVHDRDFRLTFGAIIASALGLAAVIAHVAHWI